MPRIGLALALTAPSRPRCCCGRRSRTRRNSQVDPSWPLPLPNNWIIGTIGGITVDAQDHIWINQRPSALDAREKRASTDSEREMLRAGAAGDRIRSGRQSRAGLGRRRRRLQVGQRRARHPRRPQRLRLGRPTTSRPAGTSTSSPATASSSCASASPARPTGSNDTEHLGRARPTWWSTPTTNELFVADGYGNKRVIVFDAATGAYKRHWAAYGKPPSDEKLDLGSERAARAAVHQPGALHHHRPRRTGRGLRPPAQPHAVFPQGRDVRARNLRVEGRAIPAPSARS